MNPRGFLWTIFVILSQSSDLEFFSLKSYYCIFRRVYALMRVYSHWIHYFLRILRSSHCIIKETLLCFIPEASFFLIYWNCEWYKTLNGGRTHQKNCIATHDRKRIRSTRNEGSQDRDIYGRAENVWVIRMWSGTSLCAKCSRYSRWA